MTESQLVAQILLRIGGRPDVRIWRSQPIAAHDSGGRVLRALPRGHPDLTGIIMGGRALYVEAKSATGRRSKEQVAWGDMLTRFGAVYVLARSVEDVEVALLLAQAQKDPPPS